MPASKSKNAVTETNQEENVRRKEYATEKLLKSKEFKGYQQDFARAILTKPKYTVEEAKAALDAVLKH